jgi:hypothetical protein
VCGSRIRQRGEAEVPVEGFGGINPAVHHKNAPSEERAKEADWPADTER